MDGLSSKVGSGDCDVPLFHSESFVTVGWGKDEGSGRGAFDVHQASTESGGGRGVGVVQR